MSLRKALPGIFWAAARISDASLVEKKGGKMKKQKKTKKAVEKKPILAKHKKLKDATLGKTPDFFDCLKYF